MKGDSRAKTYWQRVLYYRSRNRPITNIFRFWSTPELSLRQKLRKTYIEIALFYNGIKKIRKEIQTYGGVIRSTYGVSKIKQFLQQCYLYFIIGVPWNFSYYRKYLLFKADRWKWVREFIYTNVEIEKELIAVSLSNDPKNYKPEYDPFKDKLNFYKSCLDNEIPTPVILSVLDLNEHSGFSKAVQNLPEQDIFIKAIDGARGYGASRFNYNNGGYKDTDGRVYNPEGLLESIKKVEYNSNHDRQGVFIVQPALQNHKDWKPFTSGALATCRILTGREPDKGSIIPLAATLRMPTGSMIADNFSAGGIASPITIDTGRLGTAICNEPRDGVFEFDRHPNTGVKINGTKLPKWQELIAFTTRVHENFDFIFVGWDISYTADGFSVVEGNGLWDIDVLESPQNCPLSKTKYPILFNRWIDNFAKHEAGQSV